MWRNSPLATWGMGSQITPRIQDPGSRIDQLSRIKYTTWSKRAVHVRKTTFIISWRERSMYLLLTIALLYVSPAPFEWLRYIGFP